jgi:periplasmic copper chaperone A
MRLPWPAVVAGVLTALVGAAGLVRGATPQTTASGPGPNAAPPIVVTNAWLRPPVPPTDAVAVYFTIYNTTGQPDTLGSVVSGAGSSSVLHTVINGQMTATTSVTVPAKSDLVLAPGSGHVMIEGLYGRITAGQTVNLELNFANAGPVDVAAKVIGLLAPAPGTVATSGATK